MPARSPRPSCPSDHRHGENTVCYLHHGCGCDNCRAAQAQRASDRRRLLAYGRYTSGLVDAAPVREHLDYLRRSGMGVRTIEAVAGIPRITLQGIIWGRTKKGMPRIPAQRVRSTTAATLLALQPTLDLLADSANIDGRGTARRLQALARCGWTYPAIARATGSSPHAIANLTTASRVTARNARLIAAIYEDLWNQSPPATTPTERAMSQRTRDRAKKLRWAGPLAWEDIDADDAPATAERTDEIDDVAVDLATRGYRIHLTPLERRACVRILHREFLSDGVIADRIGCDIKTIERIREELHLVAHDQADLITRRAA